jgi:hypothetical protein
MDKNMRCTSAIPTEPHAKRRVRVCGCMGEMHATRGPREYPEPNEGMRLRI